VDALLKEPSGGNHWAPIQAAETLRQALLSHLAELRTCSESALLEARYAKFRRMGQVLEGATPDPAHAP
jgi:acetyl-CoA carboxylase carboxyl transferase subunit alpha